MNLAIYKMEMRRNLKSFIIWSGSICGILFFGMLFYPAITADGLLMQMEALFENPMMKGVLAAFGADIYSMSSLTGFYVTYNSMYNVLLACIFASVLAGNLLAKEESDKTAEFLFTRPVGRGSIFISKSAVLFTYVTLLSLLYFLTSLLAMEAVKGESPRLVYLSGRDKKLIINQIEENPEALYEAFNLDDESFAQYSLSFASGLLSQSHREMKEMNFDAADMNKLIEEAMEGPEDFFERVLNNPENYMSLFSIPPEGRGEFLENVRGERDEYRAMKKDFYQSPELFLMFFDSDPDIALEQFASEEGSMKKTIELLDLPDKMEDRIFSKYSVFEVAVLCSYVYLLVLSIGSLVLFISLLVKRGRSVLGAALGIVFFFYFINSLSALASAVSPITAALGYISPFTWMDREFSAPGFGLVWWRIALFIALSAITLWGAFRVFKRKDILV